MWQTAVWIHSYSKHNSTTKVYCLAFSKKWAVAWSALNFLNPLFIFRNELDRSETTKSKCLYESEKIQVEMEKVSFWKNLLLHTGCSTKHDSSKTTWRSSLSKSLYFLNVVCLFFVLLILPETWRIFFRRFCFYLIKTRPFFRTTFFEMPELG